MKNRYDNPQKEHVLLSIGHSNRYCKVNIGNLLAKYGGGGHAKAGGLTMRTKDAKNALDEILETLFINQSREA